MHVRIYTHLYPLHIRTHNTYTHTGTSLTCEHKKYAHSQVLFPSYPREGFCKLSNGSYGGCPGCQGNTGQIQHVQIKQPMFVSWPISSDPGQMYIGHHHIANSQAHTGHHGIAGAQTQTGHYRTADAQTLSPFPLRIPSQ